MRVKRPRSRKSRSKRSVAPSAIGLGVAALAAAPAANAAVFNVTNLNDTGAGSLRDAIVSANTNAGADVITFQAALTGTITLTTGQLYITDSVDIQGPGAGVITVSGNNASRVFYMYNSSSTIDVRIAGLTVTQGSANIGAGIVDFDENLVLDGLVISQNSASGDGAGLWADGFSMQLTIQDTTISGNTSGDDGGGIYVEDTGGPMLITNTVITGNQAAGKGGGIYFYDPDDDITIRDTTISGNTALQQGGGIYLYSFDDGVMNVESSTISGNNAAAGGGMFLYSPDHGGLIENSTISGNHATSGDGGGIYLYNLYDVSMNFVTIAGNTATGTGGGVFFNSGSIPINNSIVADNTASADNDLGGPATFDLSYTLLESASTSTINDLVGNVFNTDPQLGALANNGGPTQTQRPALTSPVVNAADPAITLPLTDQRGEPREYPTRADMGALELVGGVIQFNPVTDSVAENAGNIVLNVVRDVGPDPASVDFTTNPGTASVADYTTTSNTLNFAAGDLSETITVPIVDDTTVEGPEQFTVTLSNPSADATIGANNPATVTITDFEPGELVFSSATYSIGETGGFRTITVNRINGSDGPASVNYTTASGSATAGADFTATSGSLNWAAGDATPQSFNVPILDDNAVEGNENFTVSLNTASGAVIGTPASATVTIVDDPAGTAQFSVSSVVTAEEALTVNVTVTRVGGTEGPLSVNYATANGSASAPGDYVAEAGVVNFAAGSATPQVIDITLVDDAVPEGNETFAINLTGPGVGSPSTINITLAASDAQPIPTVSWFGKLLLTIMSGLAGLYVMMRNRLSVFFLAMLCAGLLVAPPTEAAQNRPHKAQANAEQNKKKEKKAQKFSGTVQSVESDGSNLVIHLSGDVTLKVPKGVTNAFDLRGSQPLVASLDQIAPGRQLTVKLRTDVNGVVKHVRIKITG